MPEFVRCPTCGKEARWTGNAVRPFCSERCKIRDLGNWASERYRVPGDKVKDGDADESDEDS